MVDAFVTLEISAQQYLDEQQRDPNSELTQYKRDVAKALADAERVFVPKRTGATLASIHITEHFGTDGAIEEHDNSERLVTNVLNAKAGYIRNRHSKNVKRRFSKLDTVRETHPFQHEAIDDVTVVL